MENAIIKKNSRRIITIPNILSFLRICLIPMIVWLYIDKKEYFLTGFFVMLSGLTDIIDGYVARTFNMTSELGKVLDPIADKATQGGVILLLIIDFPLLIIPLVIGIIKEVFMAITGYLIIQKCNVVLGAQWYGKAATVVLTITLILHLLWHNINPILSAILIVFSSASILLALVLYANRNFGYLLKK